MSSKAGTNHLCYADDYDKAYLEALGAIIQAGNSTKSQSNLFSWHWQAERSICSTANPQSIQLRVFQIYKTTSKNAVHAMPPFHNCTITLTHFISKLQCTSQSFSLPRLMLRIQTADDIHPPFAILVAAFPPHSLYNIISTYHQALFLSLPHHPLRNPHPPGAQHHAQSTYLDSAILHRPNSPINGRGKSEVKRTLHPSHLFLTELIVFIPLTCSATPPPATTSLRPVCITGRRNACAFAAVEDKHLELAAVVLVLEVRRIEGKSTRAVRRMEVGGIMFGDLDWLPGVS